MIGGSTATRGASAGDLSTRYAAAYRVVYRLLGDAAVADLFARDALVRAGAGSSRFRRRSADAHACLYAATVALRDELWLGRPRSLPGGTGFGETGHRDERRRLRMAVRSLLGRQRTAFILGQLAGWSPEAVAAELRVGPDAYRRTAEKAMANVRSRCETSDAVNRAEGA